MESRSVNTDDLLAAIYLARAMLSNENSPHLVFEDFVVTARDKTGSDLPDNELFALANSLAGFGMQIRGDFKEIPQAI